MTNMKNNPTRRIEMAIRALRYGGISALVAFTLYAGLLLLLAVRESEAFSLAAIYAVALGALIAILSFIRDQKTERDKKAGEAGS